MRHIHQTIKRYLLIHLILCWLISLSAALQASTPTTSSDGQTYYNYPPQNFTYQVPQTEENTYIGRESFSPYLPPYTYQEGQPVAMVTYQPTNAQYHCTSPFDGRNNGLLEDNLASQNVHHLDYYYTPSTPAIGHIPPFFEQQDNSGLVQYVLPNIVPNSAIPAFYSYPVNYQQPLFAITHVAPQPSFPIQTSIPPTQIDQAQLYSQHNKDIKNTQEAHRPITPPAHLHKPAPHATQTAIPLDQLLIPANEHCLYTTIIMGYLLPVRQASDKLIRRIDQLFGFQPAHYLNQLDQTLQDPTHNLTYLHSDKFKVLLEAFMTRMQIKKGTWGGPQEIQTIANKLKVNIQAYYPDPSNPIKLVTSNLTQPAQRKENITIHVVQGRAYPAELLTQTDRRLADDNPRYAHYRLKYTLPPSVSAPQLPSTQSPIPHQMGCKRKSHVVAWFEAAKTGNRELLAKLHYTYNIDVDIRTKDDYTALILSAKNGHLDCIKFLLEKGAYLHHNNKMNNTALLFSAHERHLYCLQYLCQQGANIHHANKIGNTALLFSAQQGDLCALTFLLQQGAYIHHKNKRGHTALLLSTSRGHLACLKQLLQYGADTNDQNNNSNTALIVSIQNERQGCFNHLVERGANIRIGDKWNNTPLLLSAQKGQLESVKYLLQKGAHLHHTNNNGDTALLLSVYNKRLDCVKYLVQKGANINFCNKDGYTALLSSAENGHLEYVKYLIPKGANIHSTNKWNNTPLMLTAYKGHLDCLKFLIQQGANLHHTNNNGDTALLLSVYNKRLDCVKYLVQKGANINLCNKDGYTALLSSAENGHLEYVKYLVQKGANIHSTNKWHNTPLMLTAYEGHLDCLKFLIQQGANLHHRNKQHNTASMLSAQNGHLDCLKYLKEKGANIYTKNKWHNTAMLLSAQNGHLDCITFLREKNANIYTKNISGYTPLLLSAENGHLDCLKYIIQQRANIHTRDKWDSTALLLSAQNGHLDCMKHLKEKGANINANNKWNNTALIWSAQNGHLDCLKYLLHQGAYIHKKNKNGSTALLLGAYEGHLDCVKWLVQQGASIHDRDNNGDTALLLSARKGYLDCIKYLKEKGANINTKNNQQNNALLLCAENRHTHCLNFLLTSVDVRQLNLQGLDLSQTIILPKNLSGMNFTNTILPKDLTNHNLNHANLTGHRFTATNFEATQMEAIILTNTQCNYKQCFQDHLNTHALSGGEWYRDNLPKDLASIAKIYPRLSQHAHKAVLLQIASGLAYLPYWKDSEFYIKVYYWSCKLLLLKKQLSSELEQQLVCSLANHPYGLKCEAESYCWQTDYAQEQAKQATKSPHNDFDQYLKTFQEGLQQYNCQSKHKLGYDWYKNNIQKNIQGLQKTYPKLTNQQHQQEIIDIAFQLSMLYQHQHLSFLLRYLSLQNRLIRLKKSVDVEVGKHLQYSKQYGCIISHIPAGSDIDTRQCWSHSA